MAPDQAPPPTPTRWYKNRKILAGLIVSVFIGVFTNLFTDFLKDIYNSNSYNWYSYLISENEQRLDALVKSRASTEYYVSHLAGITLSGLRNFALSIISLLVGIGCFFVKSVLIDKEKFDVAGKTNAPKIFFYVFTSLIWVTFVTSTITTHRLLMEASIFADDMKGYDKSVEYLKETISDLKKKSNK